MEQKRNAFPRFYFLSDDELLSILSKQDDKPFIIGFLKALFDGLTGLDMQDTGDTINMKSKEGEVVPFSKPVKGQKDAEGWLGKIQDEMKATLVKKLKEGNKALTDGKTSRKEWVLKHAGQVVATASMI